MIQKEVDKFINAIKKEHRLFAPVARGDKNYINEIKDPREIDYSGKIPHDPWKFLFFPPQEVLLNEKFKEQNTRYRKICACFMNILDLKALGLLDLVFKDDPYYQKRRRNVLVIGLSAGAPSRENFEDYKLFSLNLEEHVLEHVPFDIFFEKLQDDNFLIYSGSKEGQKTLEKNGITEYENIQFSGLIPEEGLDKKILQLQEAVLKSGKHKIWEELNNLCLACGKCSLVCPTCFCFDINDEFQGHDLVRQRNWGNCFYPEFTEIAGHYDFTDTVKKKIYFWYEHKFVRIPKEYKVAGCVSCLRCFKVCPVGINITEVLNKILKSQSKAGFSQGRKSASGGKIKNTKENQ